MTKIELVEYSETLNYEDNELLDLWVDGVVENVSSGRLCYVEVLVHFFSSEGEKLGGGSTRFKDLAAGSQLEFKIPYEDTNPLSVQECEIYVLSPDTSVSTSYESD